MVLLSSHHRTYESTSDGSVSVRAILSVLYGLSPSIYHPCRAHIKMGRKLIPPHQSTCSVLLSNLFHRIKLFEEYERIILNLDDTCSFTYRVVGFRIDIDRASIYHHTLQTFQGIPDC